MKTITSDDLKALSNENADPTDRARALSRLSLWELGQYNHLEGAIAGLLEHPEPVVRVAALKTLVFGWHREKYLDKALKTLREDSDWQVRFGAAFAVGEFARNAGLQRERILRSLVVALHVEPEPEVQQMIYQQLVKTLDAARDYPDELDFDRDRDVDWALLAPFEPAD